MSTNRVINFGQSVYSKYGIQKEGFLPFTTATVEDQFIPLLLLPDMDFTQKYYVKILVSLVIMWV